MMYSFLDDQKIAGMERLRTISAVQGYITHLFLAPTKGLAYELLGATPRMAREVVLRHLLKAATKEGTVGILQIRVRRAESDYLFRGDLPRNSAVARVGNGGIVRQYTVRRTNGGRRMERR